MNRFTILQTIINSINAKHYLEIGVREGCILLNIPVKNKHGIDPKFKIPNLNVVDNLVVNDQNNNINFLYPMTSDSFFDKYAEKTLIHGIDVAFIDGLHTYNQSLKDAENCIKYLNPNGFIVMHDCNPLNYAMAYPIKQSINEVYEMSVRGDLPGWNGCWNGDVWKTLLNLRSQRKDINVFTLDLDWGLGVITKGEPENVFDFKIDDIEDVDYYFLEKHRNDILNLKEPKYIYNYLIKRAKKL